MSTELALGGVPSLTGESFADLYEANYVRLVRLAGLLVGDVGVAEEVVQDAFIRVMSKRDVFSAPERTLAYLSRIVVNLARSRLRRRVLAGRYESSPDRSARGPEEEAMVTLGQAAIVRALRRLPARQREAVVLRYYAEFTETEAAAVMGVSVGAVRLYTARGAGRLRIDLARGDD